MTYEEEMERKRKERDAFETALAYISSDSTLVDTDNQPLTDRERKLMNHSIKAALDLSAREQA